MRRYGIRAGVALTLALTACGGSGSDPGAQPSASQTQTQTQTPSPTPTTPPVATDKKLVKQALVTAADLGKPWVQPKSVNQAKGGKGELCPGQKNAAALHKARAEESRRMTQGKQEGAAIGSFRVRTYDVGFEEKWRAAFAKATKGCASWNAAEGTFVALEVVATPPSVEGADEVLAHIERIYADKTKKQLYYVRHYYEARSGRVVSSAEYAFVQPKSDPTGKDMTASAKLLGEQVAKVRTTFGL